MPGIFWRFVIIISLIINNLFMPGICPVLQAIKCLQTSISVKSCWVKMRQSYNKLVSSFLQRWNGCLERAKSSTITSTWLLSWLRIGLHSIKRILTSISDTTFCPLTLLVNSLSLLSRKTNKVSSKLHSQKDKKRTVTPNLTKAGHESNKNANLTLRGWLSPKGKHHFPSFHWSQALLDGLISGWVTIWIKFPELYSLGSPPI